ncbi:hypothetical protein HPB49_025357 [Dermacentor silvarum]|uniref:Uncharacterized protein n=1 Tax=Dermacentor silvarum TaxID=543639 RepID=A0ACB8D925_DERSI|nr:hypothetical protein HPB49_025357 [Dermacentor silvarum]
MMSCTAGPFRSPGEVLSSCLYSNVASTPPPPRSLTSYRPISLTSVPGKTMEAMALSRLQWIADIRGAFPPEQCGFRAHRSTADCLAAVVGTLEQASRDGHAAYLLLLHVQSAFYSLPHATIISAVRALGVQGGLLAYIRAFLSDRTSAVRVGQAISSHRPVTCGVPQGSVLSPFLFNLALAPISECVRNTGHLLVRAVVYADDVALFVRGPPSAMAEMRLHLQAAVDAVGKFLRAIGLCLSATKSEELMVHPRATTRLHTGRVIIDGVCLPWRPIVRYLGLTIDHRLTWSPAVKRLRAIMRRVEAAVRALLREAMAAPSPSHRVFTLRSRSPVSCTRCRCVACDQASGDTTASTIDESFVCVTACPAHPVSQRRSQRPAPGIGVSTGGGGEHGAGTRDTGEALQVAKGAQIGSQGDGPGAGFRERLRDTGSTGQAVAHAKHSSVVAVDASPQMRSQVAQREDVQDPGQRHCTVHANRERGGGGAAPTTREERAHRALNLAYGIAKPFHGGEPCQAMVHGSVAPGSSAWVDHDGLRLCRRQAQANSSQEVADCISRRLDLQTHLCHRCRRATDEERHVVRVDRGTHKEVPTAEHALADGRECEVEQKGAQHTPLRHTARY